MKKLEIKSLIREVIKECMSNENIDAFKQDLDSQIKGISSGVKRTDYSEGDEIFTMTGSPVTFVSDTVPDKKTGKQRAIVKDKSGATYGVLLQDITPERPSKEEALAYIAGKYNKYEDFLRASERRGYDESDALRNIWAMAHKKK